VIDPGILLASGGMTVYYVWNLLIVLIMILSIIAARRMKLVEG